MLVWLMIIVGIVFLDQLTKWLTVINLDLGESYTVIEGFFNFKYVRNTGAALSMFDKPDERWIFMSISTIAIIAMFIYLWKSRKGNKLLCVALSFILGGGIGNMVDRTLLGYVVDFLDFILYRDAQGFEFHFPTFNIADSFVCIGVGLFALSMILEEVRLSKAEKAAKLAATGAAVTVNEVEESEEIEVNEVDSVAQGNETKENAENEVDIDS